MEVSAHIILFSFVEQTLRAVIFVATQLFTELSQHWKGFSSSLEKLATGSYPKQVQSNSHRHSES